jgi:pilus assembly protein FimV
MRFTKTRIILLGALVTVATLFPAAGLRALGLGEARVDSYLGQPLDVTIRLIEADPEALEGMTVRPALAEDYERLGVPSEALALELDVSVDRSAEPPRIRVRSQRAVNDPVIRFLVDARWSSGRVLREYTLFLDPPTVEVAPPSPATPTESRSQDPVAAERDEPVTESDPEPAGRRPAAVEQAPESQPAPSPEPEPADDAVVEDEPAERPSRARQTMPEDIEVGAGQTLWGIATDWRPSERLTMNQVMLAIFERNPAAFDGNVNRLLRGARLRMPDADDVEAIGEAEAERRIRQQMQTWRQQMGRANVPVIAESAVPESESEGPVADEPGADEDVVHRLDVIPPESDVFDEGPVVSEGEVRRASRRLAELEDQMYAEALENDELVRRISSIREAIETREAAGLAVADEELAEFEARLREVREAREESERLAAEALAAEEAEAEQAPGDDDEIGSYFRQLEEEMAGTDSDEAADENVDEVPADGDVEEQDEADRPSLVESTEEAPVEPSADEPMVIPDARIGSDSDRSSGTWLLIGLGAIVVVGGAVAAFWLLRRRGRSGAAVTETRPSVDAARERLQADPANLAAHLSLLKALADRDERGAFAAALDDMYRHVRNEDSPQWQEALDLAVAQAPDHPLLTPNETGLAADDDDQGLDERTKEMLGILETSESEARGGPENEGDPDPGEDVVDSQAEESSKQGDADYDLAALSNRLDEPEQTEDETGSRSNAGSSDDETLLSETDAEHPALQTSSGDDLDLDFEFSSEDDLASDDDAMSLDDLESADQGDSGEDSTRLLRTVSETESEDGDGFDDDELAADDPLRLDFEFSGQSSSDSGRDETLPLTDDIDLNLDDDLQADDDLDPDELGDDLAAEDDELVDLPDSDDKTVAREEDLDERGEREVEAFLGQDSEPDKDSDDEPEPELSDEDAEVKLDLARAYLSMDDPDSARTLLDEITSGGSAAMRAEARKLLDQE